MTLPNQAGALLDDAAASKTLEARGAVGARHDSAAMNPTVEPNGAWRVAYTAGDRTRGLVEGASIHLPVRLYVHVCCSQSVVYCCGC